MENLEFDFHSYYKKYEQGKGWVFRQSTTLLLNDPRDGDKFEFDAYCYVN